ncbi:MAG: hypothetical protein RIC19_14045 [Phaeodactylibacter sp.]|uniref:hypothetical protein n=1 Tax=Phaeodactylibacter sp. TaxID=1940289 RepID=UPI0032EA975E
MQQGLSFHSMLLAAEQARPVHEHANLAPPSGIQPGAPSILNDTPEDLELKGQAALWLSATGVLAFLLGFFAIGWILAFSGFIAAGTQLIAPERGRYWPARLALSLSMVFVFGLLGFILYYG